MKRNLRGRAQRHISQNKNQNTKITLEEKPKIRNDTTIKALDGTTCTYYYPKWNQGQKGQCLT